MLRLFLTKLPEIFLSCFRGKNLPWHILAIVTTIVLVLSGFDWWFFEATRKEWLTWFIYAAGIGGFFIPVLVSVGLYIVGESCKKFALMVAGAGVAQASLIALLITSMYKAFTGRIQPEFLTHFSTVDISKEFHFGLLQNGVFWGWPSSHTAVAFAGVIALMYLFPKVKPVAYLVPLYALFIAAGAAVGFHWFSDVVAGALIGTMVGIVVGRTSRRGAPSLNLETG